MEGESLFDYLMAIDHERGGTYYFELLTEGEARLEKLTRDLGIKHWVRGLPYDNDDIIAYSVQAGFSGADDRPVYDTYQIYERICKVLESRSSLDV